MFKSTLLYFLISCLVINSGQAQTGLVNIDTLLVGTWKGNSICQIKNSPCHDETVVYRISKNKGVDTFYIDASRMANGVEVDMGIIPFIYNKKTNQLSSTTYNGIWTFNIVTAKLDGTLMVRGDLFRKINLYKQY
ncbi:MAG TPA: hypothetical protein VGQ53_16285 [Chitinophagaceae bacterium]|jgi:hypothetical protein|nr:hypothetical protein [Chitinophagaceae bacterium]